MDKGIFATHCYLNESNKRKVNELKRKTPTDVKIFTDSEIINYALELFFQKNEKQIIETMLTIKKSNL